MDDILLLKDTEIGMGLKRWIEDLNQQIQVFVKLGSTSNKLFLFEHLEELQEVMHGVNGSKDQTGPLFQTKLMKNKNSTTKPIMTEQTN